MLVRSVFLHQQTAIPTNIRIRFVLSYGIWSNLWVCREREYSGWARQYSTASAVRRAFSVALPVSQGWR